MLELLEFEDNSRISRKLQNFQKMPQFLENTGIDRKFSISRIGQNFQKIIEFLEIAIFSRK